MQATLVVVGSRGRGPVQSLLLGSVGVALTRHASCSVVVVRPSNPGLVRHGVLVGVDGRQRSREALDFAFLHASLHRLPLTVLHSDADSILTASVPVVGGPVLSDVRLVDVEGERLLLATSVAGRQEKYPDVRVRTELTHGLPAARLVQEATRMNLVVVGRHDGVSGENLFRRSVAVTVVEHATSPVAVVPVGHEL